MGNNKQKIDYRSIKHISDHKLKQMYKSYEDWTKKNNYNLVNMNMYYPLKYRIQDVINEITRRNKLKEQNNENNNKRNI